jgi:hypothetical protein
VPRYEALRARVESTPGADAHGRALLMRQGMAAWIAAWPVGQAAAPTAREAPPRRRAGLEARPSAADSLPDGVRTQVARVLTTMVVGHLRDTRRAG